MEDWQSTTCLEPSTDEFIDLDAGWNEFTLEKEGRPGRPRLHYIYEAKLDQIYWFFYHEVYDHQRKLFQLPHALTGVAETMTYSSIKNPSQFIVDMRDENEMKSWYEGKDKNTFNKNLDLF